MTDAQSISVPPSYDERFSKKNALVISNNEDIVSAIFWNFKSNFAVFTPVLYLTAM